MKGSARYRIAIVEPSEIVAEGLRHLLVTHGFDVVSIHDRVSAAAERMSRTTPQIVFVNPSLLDPEQRHTLRSALDLPQEALLVALVYGGFPDRLTAQFDEVVSVFEEPGAIARRLNAAMQSRESDETASAHAATDPRNDLSEREREILVAVARGYMNKEIADRHNISIHTVITHRKNITRKTGIKTVAGLTIYAIMNGLVDMNDVE